MTHAMIFDAVRTPRGKGKKDGSLHEVKPVDLLAGLLVKLQKRHGFDPAALDDVVMGVRLAGRRAGLGDRQDRGAQGRLGRQGRGHADQPLLRLGPRGREHRRAEGGERLGGPGRRRRRREHVARADRLRRRRLGAGPGHQLRDRLRAAGHRRRPDRDARRLGPRGRRPLRADLAAARRGGAGGGPLRPLGARRSTTRSASPLLERDEFIKPRTTLEGLGQLKVAFAELGAMGFDAVALAALSAGRADRARAHRRQLVGHRRRRRGGADRQRGQGPRARPERRAAASSRPRSPAPTRPSCSPGRCRRRARRSPRRA